MWVFFQLEEICDAHSDAEIRDVLHSLPDGIFATYERILHKIVKKKAKTVASKMFTWITSAQRPLTVPELQEAVAFDTSDKAWDEDKIPHEDLMMEACRGLVVRDDTDNTVRLAHYTVHQYLYSDEIVQDHSFLLNNEKDYLGQMCITYLCFSDFETQIVPQPPIQALNDHGILRSGGPAWIPSVLGVKVYMFNSVYKLLRGNPALPTPTVDWIRHLNPSAIERRKIPADYVDNYALLQYVVDYWMYHTKGFEDLHGERKAVQHLAYNSNLPFEFRAWGANRHHGPYGCTVCPTGTDEEDSDLRYMSLYHYAAEIGHWLLMEPFVEKMTAHENIETLLIACRKGQTGIASRLMSGQIRFRGSPKPAIITAAQFGHTGVLQCLLNAHSGSRFRSRTSDTAPDNDEAWLVEALWIAATKGHKEVVDYLLHFQVPINHKDAKSKRTAISSAAVMGHQEVVKTLLRHGASIEDPQSVEDSALYLAAQGGHCSIVQILIENVQLAITRAVNQGTQPSSTISTKMRDFINASTSSRETALLKAAAKGHARIVQILIDHGADSSRTSKYSEIDRYHSDRGYSIVHHATLGGHLEILDVIRRNAGSLGIKTSYGRTPLHMAAERGDEKIVTWLLRNEGETFHFKDFNDDYPMNLAIRNLHYDAVCVLSDHDALPDRFDRRPDIYLKHNQPGTLEAAVDVFQRDQAILKKLLSYPRFPRDSSDLEEAIRYAKKKNEVGAVDLIQRKLDRFNLSAK